MDLLEKRDADQSTAGDLRQRRCRNCQRVNSTVEPKYGPFARRQRRWVSVAERVNCCPSEWRPREIAGERERMRDKSRSEGPNCPNAHALAYSRRMNSHVSDVGEPCSRPASSQIVLPLRDTEIRRGPSLARSLELTRGSGDFAAICDLELH